MPLPPKHPSALSEIAQLFFKLGCIGFGGPAVHIALMEKEVVQKRKWLTQQQFLDLIGATNLIPGPNSTEMAMHCGQERAGWKGLVVAGLCFITPAVLITGIFAWAYYRYGQLPAVAPFIYGIKPAIIAVVLSLMVSLGKKAFTTLSERTVRRRGSHYWYLPSFFSLCSAAQSPYTPAAQIAGHVGFPEHGQCGLNCTDCCCLY